MKNKKKFIKIIVTVLAILLCLALVIYLLPMMKKLFTQEGRLAFKEKLDGMGMGKFWVLFFLQIAQVLFVVLPGEPLEIMAGLCFGTLWGTVFIMASVAITTTLIFLLVRKFGRGYVERVFGKEKVEKIDNSKVFKNPKSVEIIMTILFIIPGTPKDLLVYLGGMLPIKPIRFILISTFARFPSIISSTLVGSSILKGNLKTSIIIYVATLLVTFVFIFIINKFDKNKAAKNAIDVIK